MLHTKERQINMLRDTIEMIRGGRVRKRQAVSKTQSGDNGQGGLTSMVCGRRTMSGRLVATARLLWVAIASNESLSYMFWLRESRERVSRILMQRVESGLAVKASKIRKGLGVPEAAKRVSSIISKKR
jgi:hypothetical protein